MERNLQQNDKDKIHLFKKKWYKTAKAYGHLGIKYFILSRVQPGKGWPGIYLFFIFYYHVSIDLI